jgi:pimeloyl-ACP methyl ester carboxylesterase
MNKSLAMLAAVATLVVAVAASRGNTYMLVDADGPQLRMLIQGNGGPAVVFENGLGTQLEYWQRTQAGASRFTTTLAYDRAGTGGSTDGNAPRDGRQVATELHAALRNSNVAPPYVLVGHSLGGLYVRIYASMYPDDVAALVLVDPTPDNAASPDTAADSPLPEANAIPATMQQARAAPLPASLPVYLISALGAEGEPWFTEADAERRQQREKERADELAAHQAWLAGISKGTLIVTRRSGHNVPVEEAGLVVATIRQALDAVTAGPAP